MIERKRSEGEEKFETATETEHKRFLVGDVYRL